MQTSNKCVIIVAGGTGSRMNSDMPKQFLMLGNEMILSRTLRKFHDFDAGAQLVVAMHADYIDFWKGICDANAGIPAHAVVAGGKTRYDSVKNALSFAGQQKGLVAVHDAVRACVSADVIRRAYDGAQAHGSAIAAVALKDSIRQLEEGDASRSVDRTRFRLVQTPQAFDWEGLYDAYQKIGYSDELTDDASVWEKSGRPIHLVEGCYKNIKITTPEDLEIAALWV
jgi:2-C-methyl-D-erythritol 4-phosphate cytidylyltransferase